MKKWLTILFVAVPIVIFLVVFTYFGFIKNKTPWPMTAVPVTNTPSQIPSEQAPAIETGQTHSEVTKISTISTIQISEERKAIIERVLQSLRDVYASQEPTRRIANDNTYWEQKTAILTDYYSDAPGKITEDDVKTVAMGIMMSGNSSILSRELEIRRTVIQEINGKINGILVPPAPDKAMNDATLAGIDINRNGVRDDVERFLAQKYGTDEETYDVSMEAAKLLQAVIIEKLPPEMSAEEQSRLWNNGVENPSFGTMAQKSVAFLECAETDKLDALDLVDFITTNTKERKSAYGMAFAGISIGDCQT